MTDAERIAGLEDEVRFLKQTIKEARERLCPPDEFCECGCGHAAFRTIAQRMSHRYSGKPASERPNYGIPNRSFPWDRAPLPG